MPQKIVLQGETIEYDSRLSRKARHLRIHIDWEKGLVVTLPLRLNEQLVEPFLREKAEWILKHLNRLKTFTEKTVIKSSHKEYLQNRQQALKIIQARVDFFNQLYQFKYKKISIRNQKTIWGSCTRSGNLQYNYKLVLLPIKFLDYVVVHELCHLHEHNHSMRFWKLVEKTVPKHKSIRKELRNQFLQVS